MEANFRWAAITAFAPVAWGTSYFVTHEFLPAEYPLYGSIIRALPAGLLLLAITRQRPRGSWWWKAAVLGTLTMGAFFALVYVAAQLLPTSIASTVMAAAPVVMMLLAWAIVAERPRIAQLVGAGLGLGLVPRSVLQGSASRTELAVVDVADFSLKLDIWVVHSPQMGNLQRAADLLGDAIEGSFSRLARSPA